MTESASVSEYQNAVIQSIVAIVCASPLRTAIFVLATVGGGVGVPAAAGFPLAQTVGGAWVALFGTVIVTEGIHDMPTLEESR